MTLKLYNTMAHKIEEFIPGGKKSAPVSDYPVVTIYSCGPTVYSYAHIGNFRTFTFNDLLRRYLKYRGFKVNHAMNITDVDDKTIKGANSENISLKEYTERYTKIFLDDLRTLNIEFPEHLPKATDSIEDMIDIITRLQNKGMVYEKEGSVYFSINRFSDYGKLSGVQADQIKSGLRYDTDEYNKDDVRDFALWKGAKENEPSWTTPFGKGRPGWHIECSAMIRRIFGDTIDIHTGGVDLIFPHHENEIAQSECAYDSKFVRYWLHAEHLLVEGSKMSKSKGNFYTLHDLLNKGYKPRAIRYLLMSAHYRKQLNFTFDGLQQANSALEKLDNLIFILEDIESSGELNPKVADLCGELLEDFNKVMDDDLNTSGALGAMFEFVREINILLAAGKLTQTDADLIIETLKELDTVFGFIFKEAKQSNRDNQWIDALVAERIEAKKNRNFTRADEIRKELTEKGVIIEDTKEGTRWKMKD